MHRSSAAWLVALSLLPSGSTARASAPERFGFGPRSSAMAGTGAATADGYEAAYANPAGAVWSTARRLTIGYVGADAWVRLDGIDRSIERTSAVTIGADLPLPLGGPLADRFALSLGFYLPTDLLNRARAPLPGTAWLPLVESPTQTISILVSGAARIGDRLSIGIGVLALAALTGTIHLASDGTGRVTAHGEEQLVTDFAPILGAQLRWTERLHLGAVFRSPSQSRYDIRVDSDLSGVLPIGLPTFAITGVSQYDPLQVGVEGSYRYRPLRLVAQLTYKRWSSYPRPTERATEGARSIPSPGFDDTLVPRLAVEWQHPGEVIDLALRGGYLFEWSPAPDGVDRTLLDANRHVITTGLGLSLRNPVAPLRLELFFQLHQLQGSDRVGGRLLVGGLSLGADL